MQTEWYMVCAVYAVPQVSVNASLAPRLAPHGRGMLLLPPSGLRVRMVSCTRSMLVPTPVRMLQKVAAASETGPPAPPSLSRGLQSPTSGICRIRAKASRPRTGEYDRQLTRTPPGDGFAECKYM